MMHPTGATARACLPFATDITASPVYVPAQSTHVTSKMTLLHLRNSNRPPFDHADYTLPLKSAMDNGRLAEIDAYIKFIRTSDLYEMAPDVTPMIHEQHRQSLMVTRESVLAFMHDGLFPQEHFEFQALALFLLTNKLFDALAWLVIHSSTDTLGLDRCNLGNEGVKRVAEWARTISFKVSLDLSNNEIDAVGAGLLAEALEADTIVELNLGLNPLGDEGVQLVCTGLSRNSSMQSLLLCGVGAVGAAIQAIAGVLDTHPSLSRLNLGSNAFDDAAAAVLAAALGRNKLLKSLSMRNSVASDAGLSQLVGALKTNTALKSMRVSLSESRHRHLPVAVAEALAINQTLTSLEVFFGVITDEAAKGLVAAVAKNTALRTFKCRLAPYGQTKKNAAAVKQIKDKVRANALIEAAGNALADLSQQPEWTVPVPSEVGQSIAAFVAQVAADERRLEAMRSIGQAGPLGPKNAPG